MWNEMNGGGEMSGDASLLVYDIIGSIGSLHFHHQQTHRDLSFFINQMLHHRD